jgi:hypothetical protein
VKHHRLVLHNPSVLRPLIESDEVAAPRRWAVVVAAAGLLIGCLAACSSGPTACGLVGAESGVGVVLDASLVPAATPVTVTACAGQTCQTQSYTTTDSARFFVMSLDSGQASVTVSVVKANHQIFAGTTTIETVKNQPNGPACGPTVWGASVTAHANGQLTG